MLADLLANLSEYQVLGDTGVEVTGIVADSRVVRPGHVFVAQPGLTHDGRQFVAEAVKSGAVAVVAEPPVLELSGIPLIVVPDARAALAELVDSWHGHPSRSLGVIGVTGTDGKTTTTHMIAAILNAAGLDCGLLSTVAVDVGSGFEVNNTHQTTPEATVVQESLARMRAAGLRFAALEVSSHALSNSRVHGCVFDCAVFTNLDPEHLDFHGTLRAYRAAKASLFAQLSRGPAKEWGRLGVVNADDANSPAMRAACDVPVVSFGFSPEATFRARLVGDTLDETAFILHAPNGSVLIRTSLTGRHNVQNWLAACAAACHFGASLGDVARAARTFDGVPGRLQPVLHGLPFRVYVDFAHTPQALDVTLRHVRAHTRGRTIVLFGQAGGRDVGNRKRMAQAVAMNADFAVVTSDDPYDEDPQSIVDDLSRALEAEGWREGKQFRRVVDRSTAIEIAINHARRGDTVILAGRGPEDTTVIGSNRIHLVDAEVAKVALNRRLAG